MKLAAAKDMVDAALAYARSKSMKPLAIVVLDARGARFAAAEDGTSLQARRHRDRQGARRAGHGPRLAHAASRARRSSRTFIAAVTHAVGGSLVPVPGGVLIRDADGDAARRRRHLRRHLRQRRGGGARRHRGRRARRPIPAPEPGAAQMPELPEVETVRRGLEPVLRGQRIVRVEQRRADLRFPLPERFAARLTGRTRRSARPARQVPPRRTSTAARCWPCTSA